MKSAKLVEAGKILVCEEKMPEIKSTTEVLVEVKAVGICGTDLHVFQGERKDVSFPRVMGHELSGIVKETGLEVSRIKKGDRVVLDPVFSCGVCRTCKKGHPNVCSDVKCYGVQMDGGFQEYIVVDEKHLYPFSDSISFEQAALAEPFSIAANIVTRTKMTKEDTVVILGAGTIGLCVLQAAKGLGARVLVSDIVEAKLKKAIEVGADVVINSKEESLEKAVEKFSPGGADVIIDAVGIAPLTEQALDLTAPLARIAIIGFDERAAQIPLAKITKKELTLVGSRMNCYKFPEVMKWLEDGKIDADLMISRRYPLSEIQKAFEDTLSNGHENVKTLILM